MPPAARVWRDLASDARYAVRRLRHAPGFTAVALLTLALGIGSTTAMFAVVDDVLVRPLPYGAPDRLVAIQENVPKFASLSPELPVSAYDFVRWRERSQTFDGFALVSAGGGVLTTGGEPVFVYSGVVSANVFSLLGLRAERGRLFVDDDERPGHEQVVVLSHALWANRFGSAADIVGQHVVVGGMSYEVVGVLPPGVAVPRQGQLQTSPYNDATADFWQPLVIRSTDLFRLSEFDYGCLGRLKRGVSLEQGRADLETLERDIAQSAGPNEALHAIVRPLQAQTGSQARAGLVVLLAAVATVLLIVCVNLSNLLLSRSLGRGREVAIRAALGASPGRIARQLLTEPLILGVAGSALGLLAANWAVEAILLTAPLGLPRLRPIGVDTPAWIFATAVTALTILVVGTLPTRRLTRLAAQASVGASHRSVGEGRTGNRTSRVLVGTEVALSAASLAVAGLLLVSFVRLTHVDTGIVTDHLLTTSAGLNRSSTADQIAFDRRVLGAVRALPGVRAVGLTNKLPLSGEGSNNGLHAKDGAMGPNDWPVVDYRAVSADYFAAVGIPLLRGRVFTDADGNHPVGLISAITAARVWPGLDPLGHTFQLGGAGSPEIEVIGIVGDVRGASLQKTPKPTVYFPFWQVLRTPSLFAVRTAGDPAAVQAALHDTLRQLQPGMPAARMVSMDTLIDRSVAARRFQLQMVGLFAAVGLALAALGVYGVVAQSVARRTREIGVRMALGATRADMWRLVAREGLAPVAVGLVVGLGIALAGGRIVRDLLFGVTTTDARTLATVAAALTVASALACYLPARRAARVDPTVVLRLD